MLRPSLTLTLPASVRARLISRAQSLNMPVRMYLRRLIEQDLARPSVVELERRLATMPALSSSIDSAALVREARDAR